MSDGATIFLSIFGGGALITLLQFLIIRHDQKKDKESGILKAVNDVKEDVHNFKEEVEERFDQMERKVDDGQAIQERARVIRFNDEVQTGQMFSRSAWAQTRRDISDYEAHCEKYDDFPNGEADAAIANLKKVHEELLSRERRGETVFL